MPLTRRFRESVRSRAANDPAFREALLQEATQALLGGDADACRAATRDYFEGPAAPVSGNPALPGESA